MTSRASSSSHGFARVLALIILLAAWLRCQSEPEAQDVVVPINRAAPAEASHLERARVHARLGLPPPDRDGLSPLTVCDVFELTPHAPLYVGRIEEGTIAPYGLLLAASGDRQLASELARSAIDGEWEYSRGYGTTAADSAMVLEGLLSAGHDRAKLRASLDRLRDRYFDASSGGFRSVTAGRAAYWHGPSVETSALIAYLMRRVDPEAFATEVAAAAHYVSAQQHDDGSFPGRWFASHLMATYQAVRLLAAVGEAREPAVARALDFIRRMQRRDGSVGGSISDTALAVLSFRAAGLGEHANARRRALDWLRSAVAGPTRPGEPFLYYWFDVPAGGHVFFSCLDRGELAKAWAQRALEPGAADD